MNTYCVFCKNGMEHAVAKNINKVVNGFEAVIPEKIVQEKRKGIWEEKKQILLPGYVFFFGEGELDIDIRDKVFNMYKILQYDNGGRELMGHDYEYALWVYRHHGSIAVSKVLTEGKTVKVVEGPLIDICGTIVKLDKHKRKAWVEIDFYGQKRIISLSAECITEIKRNPNCV